VDFVILTGVTLDDLDRALIAQLRADARQPLATLARRLKVARTTVQTRLERLEAQGVIVGYTVRLAEGGAGAQIRASVLLTIEPRAQAQILTRLRGLVEVERVHTTSGRFDLLIELAAPSTSALDRVLDEIGAIPGVRASESLIHLSTRLNRTG
jgi:DNA-binding Lrp family transcriptional regulator